MRVAHVELMKSDAYVGGHEEGPLVLGGFRSADSPDGRQRRYRRQVPNDLSIQTAGRPLGSFRPGFHGAREAAREKSTVAAMVRISAKAQPYAAEAELSSLS